MGNSASKAARKYPSIRPAVAQVVPQNHACPTKPTVENGRPIADTIKSEAIRKDGTDPQFLANLSALGQVRVDHNMQSFRVEASTAKLFESRAKSESKSVLPSGSQLYAFVLSDLLDKRKSITSEAGLQNLCKEYGIDTRKLESLARFVNSPSIDSATIRPATGKSEEEGFIATAVWVEPSPTRN